MYKSGDNKTNTKTIIIIKVFQVIWLKSNNPHAICSILLHNFYQGVTPLCKGLTALNRIRKGVGLLFMQLIITNPLPCSYAIEFCPLYLC